MSSNSQISLFRLSEDKVNEKIRILAEENSEEPKYVTGVEQVISYIVKSKPKPYDKLEELDIEFDHQNSNVNLRVFYDLIELPAKWTGFFKDVVSRDEEKFFKDINRYKTFVGFIFTDKEIFAFCGGLGTHLIRDYVDAEFGLSVLVRLIKKDDVEIKRAINRSLTGSELVTDRYFKSNYKMRNEDTFGKMYRSICSQISPLTIQDELGIPKREKDKASSLVARSYFQLGRAISYPQLLKMIEKVLDVLEKDAFFELNTIRQITGRDTGDKNLIEKLYLKLAFDVAFSYKSKTLKDYDLLHSDLDMYINATTLKVSRGVKKFDLIEGISKFSLESIFELIEEDTFFLEKISFASEELKKGESKNSIEDMNELLSLLKKYRITSFDSEDMILTRGVLLEYIQAEVELEGATYFYLEGKWYRAQTGFIEDVNKGCKELIEQVAVTDLLNIPWNHDEDDENTYVEKYLDLDDGGIFPMHKVLFNNVELCDLLIKRDRALYFVHIKQGFTGAVRDLISQVYLSAKLYINEMKKDSKFKNKEFIDGYFNALKSMNDGSSYGKKMGSKYRNFRKASFVNIFKEVDTVYYVFAVYDTAASLRRLPEDIDKFKSTIAKMSLIQLERDLQLISTRSSALRFVQIQRKV